MLPDKETLQRLREAGLSDLQIANRYGVSRQAVHRKRAGPEVDENRTARAERDKMIRMQFIEGVRVETITENILNKFGQELAVSVPAVYRICGDIDRPRIHKHKPIGCPTCETNPYGSGPLCRNCYERDRRIQQNIIQVVAKIRVWYYCEWIKTADECFLHKYQNWSSYYHNWQP